MEEEQKSTINKMLAAVVGGEQRDYFSGIETAWTLCDYIRGLNDHRWVKFYDSCQGIVYAPASDVAYIIVFEFMHAMGINPPKALVDRVIGEVIGGVMGSKSE